MGGLARADKKQWDAFWRKWTHVIKMLPEAKHSALEASGQSVLQRLREEIQKSGVGGYQTVQSWQEYEVGSKNGYVAIRPDSEKVVRQQKGIPVTARKVTGYLHDGHQTRGGGSSTKAYDSGRVTYNEYNGKAIVPGKMFYSSTQLYAGNIARAAAEQVLVAMKEELSE